jgi:hypothetical protein
MRSEGLRAFRLESGAERPSSRVPDHRKHNLVAAAAERQVDRVARSGHDREIIRKPAGFIANASGRPFRWITTPSL